MYQEDHGDDCNSAGRHSSIFTRILHVSNASFRLLTLSALMSKSAIRVQVPTDGVETHF